MALDLPALKTALEVAFGANVAGLDAASITNIKKVASDVGDAVDTFVKSGTVNTTVTTAVAAHPPGGPAVGTGTGIGNVT